MKTGNYFTDNADLVESFDRLVPWPEVVPLAEGKDADVAQTVAAWREVLAVAGRYIGTEIASRAAQVDELGVVREGGTVDMSAPVKENLRGLAALGLSGPSIPVRYGGGGLPFTMNTMLIEMLARACLSTEVQHVFHSAPAALIHRFGTDDQRAKYLPKLASGAWLGAVAMTEPQAGSDVGNLSTSATREGDDWLLNGRKQFISAGSGQFAIVLARCVPGSKGLEGLGLFIADRWSAAAPESAASGPGAGAANYAVERAEHKFTIKGSPTCALLFERSRAEALGKPGEGWKMILTFMNESRVGVGIQGVGVATAAFEAACDYAAARVQMGRPIREHPMVAEMLLDMDTTVRGMRALLLEASLRLDRTLFAEAAGDGSPAARRAARELRELTPLVKWYGAEETIRVCRLALQIHGGNGVVTEYEVERHLRDSLILPIYEGTSQIQGLMTVRDLMRAVFANPLSLVGAGPSAWLARSSFTGETGRDFSAARGAHVAALRSLVLGLVRRKGVRALRARLSDDDLGPFLLNAERIAETLAHLHVARALAEQVRIVPERGRWAARAARRARLVAERNLRQIRAGDGGVFAQIASWRRERGA
ncbi:MAG: acyl-CoA dehydrogenase family protein [Candidatus Limnocylindria bacterium]|nr:acyl-CoA dehydrogenase family protein [Candidatus Limnocylindria bacterium]